MTNYRIQKQSKLVRDDQGAALVSYSIVAGLIGVVGIVAVAYLNHSAEDRVQKLADKAGSNATIQGEASLGGEIAESTAIMGGAELPFQFGMPFFSPPPMKKKKNKQGEGDDRSIREEVCPGGKCGGEKQSCFVAGTLVLTPSGYRKIEDIRVGDEVLSISEDSPWATSADDAEEPLGEAESVELQTAPSAAEAPALGDP
jgi:Flp pilus assembly pilin Flp